jgi:hypothetical protein
VLLYQEEREWLKVVCDAEKGVLVQSAVCIRVLQRQLVNSYSQATRPCHSQL